MNVMWLFIPLVWVICGLAGATVAEHRGLDKSKGFRTAFWWGPVGLLIVAMRKEDVVRGARCQHCGAVQDSMKVTQRSFACWKCHKHTELSNG
jgi:hypothetical protein